MSAARTADDLRLLERMYAAFNARDVDSVLAAMHADVDWPNGLEGGRVVGHDAVRASTRSGPCRTSTPCPGVTTCRR